MTLKLFITGTDTDVGKTYVTKTLLKFYNEQGYQTLGLKPIASGAKMEKGKLYNDDALTLMKASSLQNVDYDTINPFVFKKPIAPHLAAQKEGIELTLDSVKKEIEKSFNTTKADVTLVEGVGGWAVPLNANELMCDLVSALRLPVILVVGIKLGCLNHAILTTQTIQRSNIPLMGWVANCIAPNTHVIEENIATLQQWIKAPCLATIPFQYPHKDTWTSSSFYKSGDLLNVF